MRKRAKKVAAKKTTKKKALKPLKSFVPRVNQKSVRASVAVAKRKAATAQKLDRNTPALKGEADKRLDATIAKVVMVTPKGFPPRPANTRWLGEIKVGKRFRKEFGDIEGDARSIDERGALLQPISITTADELIAGERRMKMWPLTKFRDQPIPVHVCTVDSIIAGEWTENANRKEMTLSEQVAMKKAMEKVLRAYAAERKKSGKAADPRLKGEASIQASKAVGASRNTLAKAEAVVNAAEADPERFGHLQEQMDRTLKVDGPFKRLQIMLQKDAINNAPATLPMKGPYSAGVIDFPHPGEKDADQESIDKRGRAMRDYPEMSIAEGLKFFRSTEFQSLWAKDVRFYFWTTNHHMDTSIRLLVEGIGVDRISTMGTWAKNRMGRGQVLRGQTEHCILAERGKPITDINDKDGRAITTLWQGDGWEVREDSRKPDAFFALVEQHTASPRYAEIFSRGGRNEKWDCHGDQAGKFAPAVAKEAQDAILKEIELTPDQQLLRVLEAIEQDETPDMRLIDKALAPRIDLYIGGAKKLALTEQGHKQLSMLRGLPDPRAAKDTVPGVLAIGAIVKTNYGSGPYRVVDIKGPFGRKKKTWDLHLCKPGEKPLKDGSYKADSWINDVRVEGGVLKSHGEDEVYVVDKDTASAEPIADEHGMVRVSDHAVVASDFVTPAESLDLLQQELVALESIATRGVADSPNMANLLLSGGYATKGGYRRKAKLTPEGEARLQQLKDQLAPTTDKPSSQAPDGESLGSSPAGVATTPSGENSSTSIGEAPSCDRQLIAFAEYCGHIVTRTIDHDTDSSVATCECGWSHCLKRIDGDTADDAMARQVQARIMDGVVADHWNDARSSSAVTAENFADWLLLTDVQAGRPCDDADLAAREGRGLVARKRGGRGFKLTLLGENELAKLDQVIAGARAIAHPDAHRTLFGQVFNEMPATTGNAPAADEPAAQSPADDATAPAAGGNSTSSSEEVPAQGSASAGTSGEMPGIPDFLRRTEAPAEAAE